MSDIPIEDFKRLTDTIETLATKFKFTVIYDERSRLRHQIACAQIELHKLVMRYFPGYFSGSNRSGGIIIPIMPPIDSDFWDAESPNIKDMLVSSIIINVRNLLKRDYGVEIKDP